MSQSQSSSFAKSVLLFHEGVQVQVKFSKPNSAVFVKINGSDFILTNSEPKNRSKPVHKKPVKSSLLKK